MYLNSHFMSYSNVQITLKIVPVLIIHTTKILRYLPGITNIDEIIFYVSQSQSIFSLWFRK